MTNNYALKLPGRGGPQQSVGSAQTHFALLGRRIPSCEEQSLFQIVRPNNKIKGQ